MDSENILNDLVKIKKEITPIINKTMENPLEKLEIISDSVWFRGKDVLRTLRDFINIKYDRNFECISEYHSLVGTCFRLYEPPGCFFTTIDIYSPLISFEHLLNKISTMLFSNSAVLPRIPLSEILIEREISNLKYLIDIYPEVEDFIEYLFNLQVKNNGKRLKYEEMDKALDDFMEKAQEKPNTKRKLKGKKFVVYG